MNDKLCIDLCSGLGGFSRAFVDAGWEVITVDVERKFHPTVCVDITKVALYEAVLMATKKRVGFDFSGGRHYEYFHGAAYQTVVVLASPPCERFSTAAAGRGNVGFPSRGIKKALEIVGACLEFIAEIRPDYWLLENPRGHLRKFLGKPPTTISYQNYGGIFPKPTDLWGNIPLPLVQLIKERKIDWVGLARRSPEFQEYLRLNKDERDRFRHRNWERATGGNSAKRAKVPLELSQAILKSIEGSNPA